MKPREGTNPKQFLTKLIPKDLILRDLDDLTSRRKMLPPPFHIEKRKNVKMRALPRNRPKTLTPSHNQFGLFYELITTWASL